MKPFRKNVAIAIDGGGIKGIIVTRALTVLEEALGQPVHQIFRLATGTSTGSIISAGIASGLTAGQMDQLYRDLGGQIFPKTLRSILWPLTPYRYSSDPFRAALLKYLDDKKLGDFWIADPPTDVVITSFDLVENRTLFIKPWKEEYRDWPVVTAVMASSTVPTYFPVVEGRYLDGGVGSYANPCYLAAYELVYCLGWDPMETTLLSFGTGRDPHHYQAGDGNRYWAWQWLEPIVTAFITSAADQQVNLVETFFQQLDFRRFQIDLQQPIAMDDPSKIPQLVAYGDEMGRMVLNDQVDHAQFVTPSMAPRRAGI